MHHHQQNGSLHAKKTEVTIPEARAGPDEAPTFYLGTHHPSWLHKTDVPLFISRRRLTGRKTLLEEAPNIRLFRIVEDDQLAELYRQADVLFLPLMESTANNALLEGLASGLPIVSSDLASVKAYVPDPAAILVARNSVAGFVAAVKDLQADPERRRRMGVAARARAMELAWPRLVGEYESLYEEACRQPSLRG